MNFFLFFCIDQKNKLEESSHFLRLQ